MGCGCDDGTGRGTEWRGLVGQNHQAEDLLAIIRILHRRMDYSFFSDFRTQFRHPAAKAEAPTPGTVAHLGDHLLFLQVCHCPETRVLDPASWQKVFSSPDHINLSVGTRLFRVPAEPPPSPLPSPNRAHTHSAHP